jgi:hypothetical protein
MADQLCCMLGRSRVRLLHRCELKVNVRLRKGSRTSAERAKGRRSETFRANLSARSRLQNPPAGAASLAGSIDAIAASRATAAPLPSARPANATTLGIFSEDPLHLHSDCHLGKRSRARTSSESSRFDKYPSTNGRQAAARVTASNEH